MERFSRPPAWLEITGAVSLAVAFAIAGSMVYDTFVRGHRQKMTIMEAVYPVTALYWGPVALWF